MMIGIVTTIYRGGTEFRIGAFRGTQFRFSSLALQKSKSPILKTEAQQRGVMSMRTKIEIHDDYCKDLNSTEIEYILSQITVLITDAALRATYQSEDAA